MLSVFSNFAFFVNASPSPFLPTLLSLLSFLLSDKSSDQAQNWETLDDATRKKVKEAYSQAGIKLMVSAFGGTSTPTTSGDDAKAVAEKMADWVIKYDLDGIDVDYEDTTAMNAKDGKAE